MRIHSFIYSFIHSLTHSFLRTTCGHGQPTECRAPRFPGNSRTEQSRDEGSRCRSCSLCHLLATGLRGAFRPALQSHATACTPLCAPGGWPARPASRDSLVPRLLVNLSLWRAPPRDGHEKRVEGFFGFLFADYAPSKPEASFQRLSVYSHPRDPLGPHPLAPTSGQGSPLSLTQRAYHSSLVSLNLASAFVNFPFDKLP